MGKPLVLIATGLCFAAFAGLLTFSYLSEKSRGMTDPELKQSQVVVAAVPIRRGDLVDSQQLKIVAWPAHAVPEGTFADPEKLIGKVARVGIMVNEPVTDGKLAKNKSSSVLSMLVPKGRRAISVRVNEVTGISGFVAPNSKVDVLVTIGERDEEPARSKIILQGVEVLAIDQEVEQIDDEPVVVKTITLDVSPRQAETLTLAANEGNLHFVLRNDKDNAWISTF
ncbi:MAG: Flp pilus assembly protein CpaB, partial [Candidatus Binatia bacterium]